MSNRIKKYTRVINVDRLTLEIRESPIDIALDCIILRGVSDVEIRFKADLNPRNVDLLNQIVENHEPIPLEEKPEFLKTTDNRLLVKDNTRPLNTGGYYTSQDDSILNAYDVGGGDCVNLNHKVGDNPVVTKEHFFNCFFNETWVLTGEVQYIGALFDKFTFELRAMVTPSNPGKNTNFYLMSSNGLILPANGNGNVTISPDFLFPLKCLPRTDTGIMPPGYWDADFCPLENKYKNLRPNHSGKGMYNLFGKETVLTRRINKYQLLGTNKILFETKDPSILADNYRLVYIFETNTTDVEDHDWQAVVNLSMFRRRGI